MSVEKQAKAEMENIDFGSKTYQVKFETSMGDILLDLFPDVAPQNTVKI